MARRASRHPVTTQLLFSNHKLMAAHWGLEAIASMRAAVVNPQPHTVEDLDMNHAVRSARMAWWHATKTKRKEQGDGR